MSGSDAIEHLDLFQQVASGPELVKCAVKLGQGALMVAGDGRQVGPRQESGRPVCGRRLGRSSDAARRPIGRAPRRRCAGRRGDGVGEGAQPRGRRICRVGVLVAQRPREPPRSLVECAGRCQYQAIALASSSAACSPGWASAWSKAKRRLPSSRGGARDQLQLAGPNHAARDSRESVRK